MDVSHSGSQSVANQNGFPRRMGAPLELIQELESSIAQSSDQRKSVMLRHLTDLFLVGSDQYSDDEIDLIDDAFCPAGHNHRTVLARTSCNPPGASTNRPTQDPAGACLR